MVYVGWCGLLDGIILRMVECIVGDDNLVNWVVVIGFVVCFCCYEVNEELVEWFINELLLVKNIILLCFCYFNLVVIVEY